MMRIRNVMALFAVLALAVALCPGIAFAASGQHQAASLQEQDALPSDLSDGRYHIVLDGDDNANVHIDKGDGRLFSDGELEVGIDADCSAGEEGVDWQLKIAVGMQGTYNDETRSFDPAFDKGEYTYDPTTKTITLDGGKIMDWADEGDWLPVIVRARIEDNAGTIRAEAVEFVEWRKARYDYFDRKWDQSMLPGWDDQVAASCNVYVENSEHPEGAELKYYVDDVKIVHQDSWEGDKEVVKLEKVADGWRYEACEYGEATLRVDYTDLGGEKQSYEFTVYVGEDVYEVDIVAEGGVERTHPGESVALTAVARHHNVDDDNASLEGVSYEWGIDDGSEFATVAPDANDPTKAVVTFKPLADEQDEIWESVCVFVRLYNGVDEEGEPDECAYRDHWFQLEQCAANEHEWETVSVTAVTCETAGVKHLQCKNCGLERDVETPALGHEWGKPAYVWADDNSTVTATRTCTRATGASCTQTETVKTTAQMTAATYTAAGKTVYTATFENTAFETQTKTVEIAKLVQLDQPMKVSAAKATVKAKKLKKKAQTVAPIKVSAQKGTVSFKVESVKGKAKKVLKLDAKTGKITVKKGTKAGTYKMTVTVTASGNDQYKAGPKIVTATVKVK